MEGLEGLFDEKTVKNISNLVEEEMDILQKIDDFKEKEKRLSRLSEEIENSLPEETQEKYDDVVRLTCQVEEYYFTLAYLLGVKHGKTFKNI